MTTPLEIRPHHKPRACQQPWNSCQESCTAKVLEGCHKIQASGKVQHMRKLRSPPPPNLRDSRPYITNKSTNDVPLRTKSKREWNMQNDNITRQGSPNPTSSMRATKLLEMTAIVAQGCPQAYAGAT